MYFFFYSDVAVVLKKISSLYHISKRHVYRISACLRGARHIARYIYLQRSEGQVISTEHPSSVDV